MKTLDSIRALAPTALQHAQPGAYFSPILATRAQRAKDAAERVSRVPRACAPIPSRRDPRRMLDAARVEGRAPAALAGSVWTTAWRRPTIQRPGAGGRSGESWSRGAAESIVDAVVEGGSGHRLGTGQVRASPQTECRLGLHDP